jgi:hypothetical protein
MSREGPKYTAVPFGSGTVLPGGSPDFAGIPVLDGKRRTAHVSSGKKEPDRPLSKLGL